MDDRFVKECTIEIQDWEKMLWERVEPILKERGIEWNENEKREYRKCIGWIYTSNYGHYTSVKIDPLDEWREYPEGGTDWVEPWKAAIYNIIHEVVEELYDERLIPGEFILKVDW